MSSEDGEGEKALSKHKELIGSRYIELFRSTTAEVQQVRSYSLNSCLKPHRRCLADSMNNCLDFAFYFLVNKYLHLIEYEINDSSLYWGVKY